jgi:hypothetical protein
MAGVAVIEGFGFKAFERKWRMSPDYVYPEDCQSVKLGLFHPFEVDEIMSDARFDLTKMPEVRKKPPRMVLYGEPKIGKTSFAASAPNTVVLPTEEGAENIDVMRLPLEGVSNSWDEVLLALRTLRGGKHEFKWLAIDTVNGAERLLQNEVCREKFGNDWTSYASFGRGDKVVGQRFGALLELLDDVRHERNMGIILICHQGLQKAGNALGEDFQKFAPSLHKHVWSLVCGWADQIGYAARNLRVQTNKGEQRAKAEAIGTERWITFEGGPALDAGCRVGYEMPSRILLDWHTYEKELNEDPKLRLAEQAYTMWRAASEKTKRATSDVVGDNPTQRSLKKLPKIRLEGMLNFLKSQEEIHDVG